MTLTRSFIASYLLIREDGNSELINTLNKALIEINDSLTMDIPEPSEKERAEQESIIKQYNTSMLNQYEILSSIFDELGFNAKERQDYREAVTKFRANETNKESLKNFILTLKGIGNE